MRRLRLRVELAWAAFKDWAGRRLFGVAPWT